MNPIALAVALALATCHGPMQYHDAFGGCYERAHGALVKLWPKCVQYQHFEPEHYESCANLGDFVSCVHQVPARCVDDIHVVTEREWQELQRKLAPTQRPKD